MRRSRRGRLSRSSYFNPRTHVGCDLIREAIKIRSGDFNPRTHVGCDLSIFTTVPYISNFNPRTHVGCDNHCCRALAARSISIHAPTWGATFFIYTFASSTVFQSTHPRGVRRNRHGGRVISSDNFNPRTHVGCDIFYLYLCFVNGISIHAPTWGATRRSRRSRQSGGNFNPRTHVGCDTSTPIHNSSCQNFNPRTHVGCDSLAAAEERIASLFQSTHPRGVRLLSHQMVGF